MSSFSDFAPRLLRAIASECCEVAREIATLGERLSAGTDDHNARIVAMQSFDYLVQHMDAQAGLISRLADGSTGVEEFVGAIHAIPLPAVRNRLLLATDMPAAEDSDEANIFWLGA